MGNSDEIQEGIQLQNLCHITVCYQWYLQAMVSREKKSSMEYQILIFNFACSPRMNRH